MMQVVAEPPSAVVVLSESMGKVDTGAVSGSEKEVIEKREKNESIDVLRGR